MGWIYETLFCTIKTGEWDNRGFLFGPVCPIYGTGTVTIITIVGLANEGGLSMLPWQVFLISVVGSAILEYVTSWALEKLFHAVWWDYSHLPLNLHGRISLFTSLGFGGGGLLIVYVLAPFTANVMDSVSPILAECLALVFVFILAVDVTLTVTVLHHFDQMVVRLDESFNQNMDSFVDGAANRASKIKLGIVDKKNQVEEQVGLLSQFAKKTIRRAYSFKDSDKKAELIKNQILTRVKKAIRSR